MFYYFQLLKNWKKSPDKNIVMFSEGNIYKLTNYQILIGLSYKTSVHYITIDPNDNILINPPQNVYPFLIKLDFWGLLFLQTLTAKLFITTTPGLGVLALKRSQNISHYSNYLHSPIDLHHYQRFSFDNFDSVICSTRYQVKTLESLELKRNSKIKEKPILGLAYYDVLAKEYSEIKFKSQDKTIFLAPSWGDKNLLNHYKSDLIKELLDHGYKVIFRPHPQSYQVENQFIQNIINTHGDNPNFSIDNKTSFIESIKKSSILISSYSGIVYDYVFFSENPCVIFDIPYTFKNSDSEDIPHECWEYQNIAQCGKIFSLSSSETIVEVLQNIYNSRSTIKESIQLVKKELANFGNAVPYIVEFYIKKLEQLDG